MLYHCFTSFKQSPLDFFQLVDSRLILMLLYDSLDLIISGVHQSHLGCWGHRSEKVKLRGLDNVTCKICQRAVLLKDKIIIRSVFGSYSHFVTSTPQQCYPLTCNSCLMKKKFLKWCPSGLSPWQIW